MSTHPIAITMGLDHVGTCNGESRRQRILHALPSVTHLIASMQRDVHTECRPDGGLPKNRRKLMGGTPKS